MLKHIEKQQLLVLVLSVTWLNLLLSLCIKSQGGKTRAQDKIVALNTSAVESIITCNFVKKYQHDQSYVHILVLTAKILFVTPQDLPTS